MKPQNKIFFYRENLEKSLKYLGDKRKILFLTTSNRWTGQGGGELPKSTQLAYEMAGKLGKDRVEVIEVPKLKIYPCEGNVSSARGNECGPKDSSLPDHDKNPTLNHRCWASINNPDDELWKISKSLLVSDCVVFFGSIRWGQMNSCYQELIERLTWLENRHASLGESNLLQKIDAGIIAVGHNWNGDEVIKIQRQVLAFYGFRVVDDLCWFWQHTSDAREESSESYLEATRAFKQDFLK